MESKKNTVVEISQDITKRTKADLWWLLKQAVDMYIWYHTESSHYTLDRVYELRDEMVSRGLTKKQNSRVTSEVEKAENYRPTSRFYNTEWTEEDDFNRFDEAESDNYWFNRGVERAMKCYV